VPTKGDGPAQRRAGEKEMGQSGKLGLGLLFLGLGFIFLYLLVTLWPAVEAANDGMDGGVTWFWRRFELSADATILLLVILVSAVGSYIHVTVSFSDFAGNRQLVGSWFWWYVLRVFVGSALAVLFYFAIRGGFFSAASGSEEINVYGIAALAGLVGLFSKQATDKLREIFDTAFARNRVMATTCETTASSIPRRPSTAANRRRSRTGRSKSSSSAPASTPTRSWRSPSWAASKSREWSS
jgi:hypothetical protein